MTKRITWVAILSLLFYLIFSVNLFPKIEGKFYQQHYQFHQAKPLGIGTFLGNFNAILVDYLFFLSDYYWAEGKWYLVPWVNKQILSLDPSFLLVWSLTGWHYAFNLALSAKEEKQQDFEIQGIKILKQGLQFHGKRYELYFDLAWIYYKRIEDMEKTIEYALKASQFEHPHQVERLLSLAYFRNGQKEKAVQVWEDYLQENPNDPVAIKNFKEFQNGIAA